MLVARQGGSSMRTLSTCAALATIFGVVVAACQPRQDDMQPPGYSGYPSGQQPPPGYPTATAQAPGYPPPGYPQPTATAPAPMPTPAPTGSGTMAVPGPIAFQCKDDVP